MLAQTLVQAALQILAQAFVSEPSDHQRWSFAFLVVIFIAGIVFIAWRLSSYRVIRGWAACLLRKFSNFWLGCHSVLLLDPVASQWFFLLVHQRLLAQRLLWLMALVSCLPRLHLHHCLLHGRLPLNFTHEERTLLAQLIGEWVTCALAGHRGTVSSRDENPLLAWQDCMSKLTLPWCAVALIQLSARWWVRRLN